MLILALDTTSRDGSIALARDDALVEVLRGDPAEPHGRRLPGDLVRVLAAHGLSTADVDVYGVAAGPGSFTGLRVGLATIQGLAVAHRRGVVPVSALAALAAAADTEPSAGGATLVAAVIDAERQEVFAALYRRRPAAPPRVVDGLVVAPPGFDPIADPLVTAPAGLAREWCASTEGHRVVAIGDGARRYRETIAGVMPAVTIAETVPPLAPSIARLAAALARAGATVPPHAIRPVYVRRSDAELARERRTEGQGA